MVQFFRYCNVSAHDNIITLPALVYARQLSGETEKGDYGSVTIIAFGVGVAGLEPTTSASRTQHSTN
jgi:hypothetical protein